MTTRKTTTTAAAALAIGALLAPAATAASPAPSRASAATASATCADVTWGSLAKSRDWPGTDPGSYVAGARAGTYSCSDKVVLDLGKVSRSAVSYDARYVNAVYDDFSGEKEPLAGGAFIELHLGTPTYVWTNDGIRSTWAPANPNKAVPVSGYTTLRQVALVSSWEGTAQIGVGVRARLPMRVTTATRASDGHTLLTLEVRHTW